MLERAIVLEGRADGPVREGAGHHMKGLPKDRVDRNGSP